LALEKIKHVPASIREDDTFKKHNTGVYCTSVPYDAVTGLSTIDYREAEERGYFKIDLLNMTVYQLIRDQAHYDEMLAQEPPWHRLQEQEFCERIAHIGNHYDLLQRMPEPVDSIARMAMFLAVIRPGKRHLIGKTWQDVAATVWDTAADGYIFKRSHAVAYAHLVTLHMNLLYAAHQGN
jgi:hypothetical protein